MPNDSTVMNGGENCLTLRVEISALVGQEFENNAKAGFGVEEPIPTNRRSIMQKMHFAFSYKKLSLIYLIPRTFQFPHFT